jgi:hypothetical protein
MGRACRPARDFGAPHPPNALDPRATLTLGGLWDIEFKGPTWRLGRKGLTAGPPTERAALQTADIARRLMLLAESCIRSVVTTCLETRKQSCCTRLSSRRTKRPLIV